MYLRYAWCNREITLTIAPVRIIAEPSKFQKCQRHHFLKQNYVYLVWQLMCWHCWKFGFDCAHDCHCLRQPLVNHLCGFGQCIFIRIICWFRSVRNSEATFTIVPRLYTTFISFTSEIVLPITFKGWCNRRINTFTTTSRNRIY